MKALAYKGVDGWYFRAPFDPAYDMPAKAKYWSFVGLTLEQRLEWCNKRGLDGYEVVDASKLAPKGYKWDRVSAVA